MKPIIKYTGGKREEIKFFNKWLQVDYDRYVEPFFGGGAVYFYLEPKNSIINDVNVKLIDFYNQVAFNRENLIEELKRMKNEEEFYYVVRKMYNEEIPKEFSDAAILAYINRTAFSGMIRYSKGKKNEQGEYIEKPKFNVPFGRYKTFHPWDFMTEGSSNLLKTAQMVSMDFSEIFKMLTKRDFVFLDPPYLSKFREYQPESFSEDDHRRLAKCFKETPAKCLMVVSDLGIIRELYEGYVKGEYDKNYAINVKNRMKDVTEAKHLIIANYDI